MFRPVPVLLLLWLLLRGGLPLLAQSGSFGGLNPAAPRQLNLTYFEAESEVSAHPAILRQVETDFLDHPELLSPGIKPPCANCTERVDRRTAYAKYFYDNARPGQFTIYQSNAPIHYRDAQGWWRTIDPKLRPVAGQAGVYAAAQQPAPTRLNLTQGYAALQVGKGLELRVNERVRVYTEDESGVRLWGHPALTAGNASVGADGMHQKNVLEGLDRDIIFGHGSIKTNYILNKRPEYLNVGGSWIVEEEWDEPSGTQWVHAAGQGTMGSQGLWYGALVLVHRATGDTLARLRRADIWDAQAERPNRTIGGYRLIRRGNQVVVQLVVPGRWLLAEHVQYPVTVDPLLEERTSWPNTIPFKNTPAASRPVADPAGGFNCASRSIFCSTTMNVNLPPQASLSRVAFQLEAVNQAALGQQVVMATSFFNPTCNINEIQFPGGGRGVYGGGGPIPPGGTIATLTRVGNETVITPYLMTLPENCPEPSCQPAAIPFEMRTYQCDCETANDIQCVPADVARSCMIIEANKWVMVAEGNTVEPDVTSSAGRGDTLYVCAGDLVTFQANAKFGVAPYVYRWTLGGAYEGVEIDDATGRLTHRPTQTGTYRYTINYTDQCGTGTDPITYTVVVRPGPEVQLSFKKDYDCTPGRIELNIAPNTEPAACVTASASCPPRLQRTVEVTEATLGRTVSTLPDRTPFNGNRSDFRVQYMYPRAVLTNPQIDLKPGKITQLSFLFQSKASIIPYRDFRIKMGCTDLPTLRVAQGFVGGLSEVFYRREYTVQNVGAGAWLSFDLDNAYVWDGTRNLVIEFSYNNQSSLGGGDNILFFAYAGGNPSPNTVIWSGPPANPDVVGEELPAAQEPSPTRLSFPVIRFRQCFGELWNRDQQFYSQARNIPVSSEDPTGLQPGVYDFFYIDEKGCSSPLQVPILRVPPLEPPLVDALPCPNRDGKNVILTPRGGVRPYLYRVVDRTTGQEVVGWQPDSSFLLPAGNYDFFVRGADWVEGVPDCEVSVPDIEVASPLEIVLENGCVPNLRFLARGGAGTRRLFRARPGNIESPNGNFGTLPPGIYTIELEGEGGCTVYLDNFEVAPELQLNVLEGCVPPGVRVEAQGGVGTARVYTAEPGGLTNADGNFGNLPTGTYQIRVRDERGCTDEVTLTLYQATIEVETSSCDDPNVRIRVRDGAPLYEYAVDSPTGPWQNEPTFRLPPGMYDFFARDPSTGCILSAPAQEVPEGLGFQPRRLCPESTGNNLIFANVRGGSGQYEYTVDNGASWAAQTGFRLPPGRYRVGIRDAQDPSCQVFADVDILEPLTITVPCPESNELETAYIFQTTGGGVPKTYRLFNPAGFDVSQVDNPRFVIPENILPGSFTVRVSYELDGQTCQREQQLPLFPRLILNEIPCPDANGNAALQAQGGNSSQYIFGWIDGGTDRELARGAVSRLAVALPPGTRRYYVIDGSGCRAEREMTNVGRIVPVVPDCPAADGLLTVTTNPAGQDVRFGLRGPANPGPPAPGDFVPGSRLGERDYRIPDDFNVLPGTYRFYLSYGGGECLDSVVAEINRPVALEPLNPICDANGYRLTLVPTPGTGIGDPATFSFAQGTNPQPADFGPNRDLALPAGQHTLWVRDRRGCTASRTLTVSEPVRIVGVNLCPDNDGNIRVTVTGGSGSYRYASVANPQAGDFSDAPTESGNPQVLVLPAARFTPQGFLTVRDASGPCFAERDIRIEALTASVVKKDLDCFGADQPPLAGRLTVTFTGIFGAGAEIELAGGNGPIVRPLNPNPDPVIFDGLQAGTYRLSIRNPNGCGVAFLNGTEFIIEQPAEFIVSADTVGIRCNGDLPPTGRVNILQVTAEQGAVRFTLLNATNFPMPFNATENAFLNLPAGSYSLVVEDARGCLARIVPDNPLIIREPEALRVTAVPQPVSCTGALGRIDVNAAGGTKPYRVQVIGQAEQTGNGPRFTFPDLNEGMYGVLLLDARDCPFVQTDLQIDRVDKPVLTLNAIPPSCPDATDGQIEVVAGGTSPGDLIYRLFNAGGAQIGPDVVKIETDHTFVGLDARPVSRSYEVQVIDAAGCTSDRTAVQLDNPPAFVAEVLKTDVTCRGANDGQIQIELLSGGLDLPITYVVQRGATEVWNQTRTINDPDYAQQQITGLEPGSYTISVTYPSPRGGACTAQVNSPITINQPARDIVVTFFRQPENVKCFGELSGEISVNVQNGQPPIEYIIYQLDEQDNRTEYARYFDNAAYTQLGRGRYVLVVQDANGCAAPDFPFTIDGPTAPFAFTGIIKEQDETCPDLEDGIFELEIGGGSRTMFVPVPYRYDLIYEAPDGSTTTETGLELPHPPRFTGQKPGRYTFTVRDGNDPSCGEETFDIEIVEKPDFDAIAVITQGLECEGQAAGAILISYSGGTEPVSRRLIDPDGLEVSDFEDQSPLDRLYRNLSKAGRYTAEVVDADGCAARFDDQSRFELVAPSPIVYQGEPQVVNVRCKGQRTGSISVSVTGGVGQLTFILTGGDLAQPLEQNTGNFTNLAAGVYRINVRDSKTPTPCEKEYDTSIELTEPAEALADAGASVTDERCFETNDGSITLAATGGTPPYRYAVGTSPDPTNFQTDFRFENLTGEPAPGREYFYVIEDANGCRIAGGGLLLVRPEKVESLLEDVLECSAIPLPYTRQVGPGRPATGEWRSSNPEIIRGQGNGIAAIEITRYGSYQLTYVVNDCESEPVRIVIYPNVQAGPDVEYCADDRLPATHRNPATPATGGTWSSVGNRAPIDPTTGDIQLAGLQPGLYTFRYEVSPECWDEFDLILKRQPDASFETSEPTSFRDGDPIWYIDVDEIQFINTSTASPSNRYRWDLGDGTTSTDRDTRHIYRTEKNAYTVTLVVRDDEGCEARATKQIRVEKPPVLSYPGLFTPNGDGINDFLELLPHPEYEVSAVIFDRLGNKLYVWSPDNPRWDGTINGQPVPETAYFYVIDYTHRVTGRKDMKKGTVTLLR